VTPDDYILGVSDLTGELMRYATNGASESLSCLADSSSQYRRSRNASERMRLCSHGEDPYVVLLRILLSLIPDFDGITPQMLRKLKQKQEETTRSLEKIEKGEPIRSNEAHS